MSGTPRTRSRRPQSGGADPAPPKAPRKKSDLGARVAVALPALVAALVLVELGGWWFTAGAAVLALVCAHEFFRMYEPIHPVRLGGFIGILALCIAAHTGGREHLSLAVVITFLIVFLLSFTQVRATAVGVAMTIFAVTWIGLGVAHAILLRDLFHGAAVLFDVLAGTFVGDTAAYLGGRAFGRTKLSPAISPIYPALNYAHARLTLRTMNMWMLEGAYETCVPGERYRDPSDMSRPEFFVYRTVAEDFARAPPQAVVVDTIPGIPFCGSEFSFIAYFSRHPLFAETWAHYRLAEEWGRYQFYIRKD